MSYQWRDHARADARRLVGPNPFRKDTTMTDTITAPASPARPGDLAIIDEADHSTQLADGTFSRLWLAEVIAVDADGRVTEVVNVNGVDQRPEWMRSLRRIHVMSATVVDVAAAMAIERRRLDAASRWVSLEEIRDRLAPARIR